MGEKKLSIAQIDEMLNTAGDRYAELIAEFGKDERAGVQKLVKKYENARLKLEKEMARLEDMLIYERKYAEYELIAGMDEVGRGPLAGPVVTCAVILPKECKIMYINDSKQLSAKQRDELYEEILDKCIAYSIGCVDNNRIDEINILQATYEAMRMAVAKMEPQPQILLNDAVTVPGIEIRQVPIIKGDAKSASIAAASIVAKVTRDRMMEEYDKQYPGYAFASNKGYGSAEHLEGLRKLGPTPLHRKTFIKNLL